MLDKALNRIGLGLVVIGSVFLGGLIVAEAPLSPAEPHRVTVRFEEPLRVR